MAVRRTPDMLPFASSFAKVIRNLVRRDPQEPRLLARFPCERPRVLHRRQQRLLHHLFRHLHRPSPRQTEPPQHVPVLRQPPLRKCARGILLPLARHRPDIHARVRVFHASHNHESPPSTPPCTNRKLLGPRCDVVHPLLTSYHPAYPLLPSTPGGFRVCWLQSVRSSHLLGITPQARCVQLFVRQTWWRFSLYGKAFLHPRRSRPAPGQDR